MKASHKLTTPMSEPDQQQSVARLIALFEIGNHEETVECLDRLG